MAKATVKLPNGTLVTVEGTPEEVAKLLEFYSAKTPSGKTTTPLKQKRRIKSKKSTGELADQKGEPEADLSQIVNLIKNCDEAEAIESQILDRTSQVDRTLLPLYVVHEYMGNDFTLTSGEISQITTDLGIPIAQPNVSRTLSGTASRYVIGDKVRKKGQTVKYKLSRRGIQYLKSVLKGTQSED
jgi:hypothetical protein